MSNDQLEKAQQLSKLENWAQALEMFNAVLAEEPSNLEAMIGLGNVFYHLQRYEEGRKILESSIQISTENPEAHFLLGSTCYMLRDWYAAMTHYHEAAVLSPTTPEYRLRLYAALQMLNEPELALAELEVAYQLDPQILGPRGKARLWRVRIFAGLGPVVWLGGWVFFGVWLTLGGSYYPNQFLDWLGRYLPLVGTRLGQVLLRAGLMSLPFVVTAVHQLRKRCYRRVLWVVILWVIWGLLVWYIPHRAGWW